MESLKKLVDINALVARCCWKDFGGEMEGESFLEECIALKQGMENMNKRYVGLLSNKHDILMTAEMYHIALKKEEEESDRLTHELEITSNSLKSTQISLREVKL